MIKDIIKFILLSLLICFPLYRDKTVIDGIAYQWFFLSSFNLLSFILILITDKSRLINLVNFFKNEIYTYIYLFFLIISTISLVNSINLSVGLVDLSRIYIVFCTIITVYTLLNLIENKEIFYSFITYLSLLFCFIEVSQIFKPIIDKILQVQTIGRSANLKGITYNINVAAFSLLIKIPFLIYIALSKSLFKKILSISLLFSFLVCLLIIQSRASFIGLILISLLILSFKQLRKKVLLIPVIMSILFVGLTGLSNNLRTERITNLNYVLNSDQSSLNRLRYWSDAINTMFENPFFGIGIGSWKIESINYSKEYIREYTVQYHVHNDFLQFGAELGVFGLIIYFILFLWPIYILFKIYNLKQSKVSILLLMSLSMIFIDSFFNFPRERALIMSYYSIIVAITFELKSTLQIKRL